MFEDYTVYTPEATQMRGIIKKKYDKIIADIDRVNDEIGKEIYLKHVEPFCKKWNLTFDSGMGTWVFSSIDTKGNNINIDIDRCGSIIEYIDEENTLEINEDGFDDYFPVYRNKDFYYEFKVMKEILDYNIRLYDMDAFAFVPNVIR